MTLLPCMIIFFLGNGGWLFTGFVNSAGLGDYFEFNITENEKKKVFVNNDEEFTFNVSIVDYPGKIAKVVNMELTFRTLNITAVSNNKGNNYDKVNNKVFFKGHDPPTDILMTFHAVLQSLLPPLTKVEIEIYSEFTKIENGDEFGLTKELLYVNPPKITTNLTTNTVELVDQAKAIKVNIVGIQGDFPLTLEIICGINETNSMMVQLIDEGNQSLLSEFTQATLTIPYSENTKTDESFILLLNRTVMDNTENITDVIAIGLLLGDNGAVVEHIQVNIPKVETTEQLGNTSESKYNWLTIGPSIGIEDFMITRKKSFLKEIINIPPDSYSLTDTFRVTVSSNHSSVKLSQTTDFSMNKKGVSFHMPIELVDDIIYPLQNFHITFKLYKNHFQLYQSYRYCFYGGLPNIMKTSFTNKFMPGMNLNMGMTIDQSNMISSNVSIYVQIKLPSSNEMPYLKYESHEINSSSGSEVQNHHVLESTFNDGNKDMIYIEMLGRPDEKDTITLEINATVLENPSLNNTPHKYPISVAVVIGPYMAYFDEKEIYLKRIISEMSQNTTEMPQKVTEMSQNITGISQNDTEHKKPKIKMEVEAIIASKDDVSIKILVENDSPNGSPISNLTILLYKVPFIAFEDFNINSNLKFQHHGQYAQLWKFQGNLLSSQRIVIDQKGKILQKFLLEKGLNELYLLMQISFKNQSGETIRMDKLAPIFIYKKPMVIAPPHSKRLQEYYGLGLFFDEKENGLNIFACMNQHKTSSEVACFHSDNYGATWKEMDLQLGCIIGYNHDRTGLVGISRNQQYYIHYRDESRCYAPYKGDKTHFGTPVVLEDAEYVKMEKTANVKEQHKKVYKGSHEFAGTVHGLYYRDKDDINGDWLLRMKW